MPDATIVVEENDAKMEDVQERIAHPAPVLIGPVADRLNAIFTKIFDSEGSYAGEAWAPLSPYTLERKAQLGYPDEILVAEGNLRASLTDPFGHVTASLAHLGSGYKEMRDDTTVAVGTTDESAGFHQGGTSRMPARPIAPEVDDIPDEDIDAMTEMVANYILGEAF